MFDIEEARSQAANVPTVLVIPNCHGVRHDLWRAVDQNGVVS